MRFAAIILLCLAAVCFGIAWTPTAPAVPGSAEPASPQSELASEVPTAALPAASATAVPAIADPHQVGPCPKQHAPVLRRGLDSQGQPTWWHVDGSMTVRVQQGYTAPDGRRHMIPRIVVVRPAVDVAAGK